MNSTIHDSQMKYVDDYGERQFLMEKENEYIRN